MRKRYHAHMSNLYTIRTIDPRSERELETVTCYSVMTIWESRPELRKDPQRTPGYSWAETEARIRAGLRGEAVRILVAVDSDGHLVGDSIVVLRHDAKGQTFGYFWSRYVLPRARRQGLARQFLTDAMSWFRAKGARYAEVHIHTENHGLRKLFEGHGFRVVDRGRDNQWSWLILRSDV